MSLGLCLWCFGSWKRDTIKLMLSKGQCGGGYREAEAGIREVSSQEAVRVDRHGRWAHQFSVVANSLMLPVGSLLNCFTFPTSLSKGHGKPHPLSPLMKMEWAGHTRTLSNCAVIAVGNPRPAQQCCECVEGNHSAQTETSWSLYWGQTPCAYPLPLFLTSSLLVMILETK